MTLETVESDVIHAIGYADDVNVLEIIFNNGRRPHAVMSSSLKCLTNYARQTQLSLFQNNIRMNLNTGNGMC